MTANKDIRNIIISVFKIHVITKEMIATVMEHVLLWTGYLRAEIAYIRTLASSATSAQVDIGLARKAAYVIRPRATATTTAVMVNAFLRANNMSASA